MISDRQLTQLQETGELPLGYEVSVAEVVQLLDTLGIPASDAKLSSSGGNILLEAAKDADTKARAFNRNRARAVHRDRMGVYNLPVGDLYEEEVLDRVVRSLAGDEEKPVASYHGEQDSEVHMCVECDAFVVLQVLGEST